MRKRRSVLGSAVAIAGLPVMLMLGAPASAYTIDIDIDDNEATHETLELYGILRLSVDYADSDLDDESQERTSEGLTDGDVGVSSNTSILGFKGVYNFQRSPYSVVWQIEQSLHPDTGSGETFKPRDTYLGVKTPVGLFRAGILDTPYKVLGLVHPLYTTTAGDPHAILGKSSISAARLDLRAKNSLYYNGDFGGLKVAAQYATDAEEVDYALSQPVTGTDEFIDDNSGSMYSLSLGYDVGGLKLSTAWVDYKELYGGSVEAWRVAAQYAAGPLKIGALYGDIATDEGLAGGSLDRAEYGAYAQYAVLPGTMVGVQWMHADESEYGEAIGADDSADQFSLGVYQRVFPRLMVHAIATTTLNEEAASYGSADYAHGDRVRTVAGGEPMVFSVGAQYTF